jgi:hypothetical protein
LSTLGEILDRLQDRSQVYEMLAESGNIPLIAELDRINHHEADGDLCEFALRAVQAFTSNADDEAWVKLIGRIQNSQSPAGACLSEMIAWSLAH